MAFLIQLLLLLNLMFSWWWPLLLLQLQRRHAIGRASVQHASVYLGRECVGAGVEDGNDGATYREI